MQAAIIQVGYNLHVVHLNSMSIEWSSNKRQIINYIVLFCCCKNLNQNAASCGVSIDDFLRYPVRYARRLVRTLQCVINTILPLDGTTASSSLSGRHDNDEVFDMNRLYNSKLSWLYLYIKQEARRIWCYMERASTKVKRLHIANRK